jgi:hypothetical protein
MDNKIKAETAEELEQVQTIAGMRSRIVGAQLFDPLVKQVFRIAKITNLGGEDTYTLMAYHSLVAKESLQQQLVEHIQRMPSPPFCLIPIPGVPRITRQEHLAVLKLLVRRATWADKWYARRIPGHWLNAARQDIAIG